MSKILAITDMAFAGSGYYNLMSPMLAELSLMGHDIKVIGLANEGTEHVFPFSIIPCKSLQEVVAIAKNLDALWKPEIVMVGLDVPLQLTLFEQMKLSGKYIGVAPLENPPLTMSWAAGLMQMDHVFLISEVATQAAIDAGLHNVSHLQVGVDTISWRIPTTEERKSAREALGYTDNDFVVFTNADNQERKNLWAAFDIVSRLEKDLEGKKKVKFLLLTREHSQIGHKLRDLAMTCGISRNIRIFERGLSQDEMWSLYTASDVLLLTSKAEGLGLPVLEAMANGLPVVATKTGALPELLRNDRGYLISPEYTFIDVWGNSRRDMINRELAAVCLYDIATNGSKGTIEARKYVEGRTFEYSAKVVDEKIKELLNG